MKIQRSFTFRLALIYMSLFGLSILLLMLFIYWFTAADMVRESDLLIETEINDLADRYDTLGLNGLNSLINSRISRQPRDLSIYLLTAKNYYPLEGNLDKWPEVNMDANGWIDFTLVTIVDGNVDELAVRAKLFILPGGYHLLVGRIISHLLAVKHRIIITLAWGFGFMLVIGSLVGWWMSQQVASRIETINLTNRDIMNGDLSRRIPLQGSNDELDRLAEGLNDMLDKIQALMEDVRRVSDNIAHDLRTPLGRLHNMLDDLYHEVKGAGLNTNSIEQALKESEGLLNTFNALLRIARIEAHSRTEGFTTLDFTALVLDVVEYYEPLAEARQQNLVMQIDQSVQLLGDSDLLFQAIANLLDNAIKYTPRGGEVQVKLLKISPGNTELSIVDTGPGIPADMRQQVLQRFFRLEDSRSTAGSGLGLSLVEAVVNLHSLSMLITDNSPGTRITLSIPDYH